VLIDGDDHNDPVADSIRGTLDGHLVLDRAIADQGRYPAVNVLSSVSRLAHHVWTPEQRGSWRCGSRTSSRASRIRGICA
jgi:flagellum-specific ATP synthase